ALCEGVLEKWWVSYREKAVRAILERHALESDGKTVSLSAVPGSPSGLRPPVNPGKREGPDKSTKNSDIDDKST
ncbi:MAG: hypothetical protein IJQ35_00960, partial [Bacteroidales bacterium]|nr:hypothetical protein [Bacteroidales bacterium]